MIRTLIIEPAGGLWGSERALLDLIEAAPDLDVAICCPPGTPLVRELERRGVRVFPWFLERLHEKARWRRAQAALGVLCACLAFRPQVIHINQSGAWRVTLPAAALLDLPVVCHVRIFEDAAYLAGCCPDPRRLKSIIAISRAVEDEVRTFKALEAIPVHRIYDAYARAPTAPATGRIRGRIACVGRVAPIKGQAVLLQAIAQGGPLEKAECLIVGDGEATHVAELKAISPPGVEWRGFVSDVAGLLRTCGVLACPSHAEPLGRVIFEAWDAGAVPVVFAGAGGAAEIVAAAEGGFLYEEQTPEALAGALLRAISLDEDEAARLAANGLAWLEANCGPAGYGQRVTDVLAQAAA
ncbi:MAG: glycosyltransferase family 4 protein [Hyphomicrobiaceae bacterium]|nr:glycosyltransferase family 4 protein [Hyphomicrobiaceae bacterium]